MKRHALKEFLEPLVKELVRKECVSGRLSNKFLMADAKKVVELLQPQIDFLAKEVLAQKNKIKLLKRKGK